MKKRKPAVGVIGLGIMGGAMAEALLAAGHDVVGYDPAPAARRRLERAGGHALQSSFEVAEGTRVLIMSLPSSPALEANVRELAAARAGRGARGIAVESSTLPTASNSWATIELASTGWTIVDCLMRCTAARLKHRDW